MSDFVKNRNNILIYSLHISKTKVTEENLLFYFLNILIYDRQFDEDYSLLLFHELINTKNKIVSLKLIYEFSIKIKKELSIDQIKDILFT